MNGRCVVICVLFLSSVSAHADDVIHRYNGDILPADDGWITVDPCSAACSQSIVEGHLAQRWDAPDAMSYRYDVFPPLSHAPPDEQPPATFWVEWRARSSSAFDGQDVLCEAAVAVYNFESAEITRFFADWASNQARSYFHALTEPGEFHTFRYESPGYPDRSVYVDGALVYQTTRSNSSDLGLFVWMIYSGGLCSGGQNVFPKFVDWDHVWFGTLSDGEEVIAADPPAGVVDARVHPDFDRFTITFDAPAYVVIDDVTVEVLPPAGAAASGGGQAPAVARTRRLNNGEPDQLEIVLDGPLPLGATTRFTFDTSGPTDSPPSILEYTYLLLGSCCLPQRACIETDEQGCADQSGGFTTNDACEGDQDGDGVDALCGDQCPLDPVKLSPGQCGCGHLDTDADADTVAYCVDQCPDQDDRIDTDSNGQPDCNQFFPIPAVSTWGLGILALVLLIAAKTPHVGLSEPRPSGE